MLCKQLDSGPGFGSIPIHNITYPCFFLFCGRWLGHQSEQSSLFGGDFPSIHKSCTPIIRRSGPKTSFQLQIKLTCLPFPTQDFICTKRNCLLSVPLAGTPRASPHTAVSILRRDLGFPTETALQLNKVKTGLLVNLCQIKMTERHRNNLPIRLGNFPNFSAEINGLRRQGRR